MKMLYLDLENLDCRVLIYMNLDPVGSLDMPVAENLIHHSLVVLIIDSSITCTSETSVYVKLRDKISDKG